MVEHAPRDMEQWMKSIERRLAAARQAAIGIPFSYNEKLKGDILADKLRHPTAPVEITWQTALYQADGLARDYARIMVDFPDVTKATDGTDIPIREYELWGRDDTTNYLDATTDAAAGLAAPGLTIPNLASTAAMEAKAAARRGPFKRLAVSPTSSLRADGLVPGTIWTFKVRAIGRFTVEAGEFSNEFQAQMDEDTTPPPQPTVPQLTSGRGVISVRWDGLAVTGSMPADLAYVIVAWGDASSPINELARFHRGGGLTVISDTDYYTPQFVRFQAVDLAGNRSPWSEQAVAYTEPLVDADVILSELDGARTLLRNIDARTAILDGTIITEHLLVTEDMTAALAQFLHVRAGMIEANAVEADKIAAGAVTATKLETDLALITRIIAGRSDGTHAQMDPNGFRVYAEGIDGAAAYETVRMGVSDSGDLFAVTDSAGNVVAQIDSEGTITGKSLEADETLYYKGEELSSYIDSRPRGMAAWGQVAIASNMSTASEVGLFEIAWASDDDPVRMYQFNLNDFIINVSSPGTVGIRLRYTKDGSVPNVTSPIIGFNYHKMEAAGFAQGGMTRIIGSNNGNYLRVLVCLYAAGGSVATVWNGTGQTFLYSTVMDLGATIPDTASATTGGGVPYTGSTVAAPATPKVTKTVEYGYTSVKSYLSSGAAYNYSPTKAYQGLSPAGYGNLSSQYAFNQNFAALLSGATINGIWVYLYFEHWYNNAGGTAQIRFHNNLAVPASNTGMTSNGMNSSAWPKAAGRWVAVPSSLWAGFASGAYKGFGLVGDGTYNTYGIANNARIRIKYTK